MKENALPEYDFSDNPTGCCPKFNPEGWDHQNLHFKDKLFVKAETKSVMHIPVNMGKVFAKTFDAIEDAKADEPSQLIVLSRDTSPWNAEHLFSVTQNVPGQEMVWLSGDFKTKVFEGPYKDQHKWEIELRESTGRDAKTHPDTMFFYTTCPKCAEIYGKNYVVGLVGHSQISERLPQPGL